MSLSRSRLGNRHPPSSSARRPPRPCRTALLLALTLPLGVIAPLGRLAATAHAAPSPRDELDDLVAEARRLGARNGASLAAEVLAELEVTIAEAQRQLAAGAAVPARRATERARGLLRLASATIARSKAEREATELHAAADARTDEAAAVARTALMTEADLARVEANLSQPGSLQETTPSAPVAPTAQSTSAAPGSSSEAAAAPPPTATSTAAPPPTATSTAAPPPTAASTAPSAEAAPR